MKSDYRRRVIILKEEESKKPDRFTKYWVPFIPLFTALLIAGGTWIVASRNNFFDVSNKLLEIRKFNLEKEVAERTTELDKKEIELKASIAKNKAVKNSTDSLFTVNRTQQLSITRMQVDIIRMRKSRDSIFYQFNEQKSAIRSYLNSAIAIIKTDSCKKAEIKVQHAINRFNKIIYRYFSPEFDSAFGVKRRYDLEKLTKK